MRYLLFIILLPFFSPAQDTQKIVIGIKHAPPFVITEGAEVRGLSIDFWELISSEMEVEYQYKTYKSIPALVEAVEKGEVDMSINPLSVSAARMEIMSFSQPFYIAGTAIVREKQNSWWSVVRNMFSWEFFSAVLVLVGLILIFGFLVWYFERRVNPDQFSGGFKGLGDGFWWSAVTMTTVGYGDKSPVSKGGRFIALIWMFTGIIMISGLTAGIASALTVSSMEGNIEEVDDLRSLKVATIQGSSSASYLRNFRVETQWFVDVETALNSVKSGESDVLAYDRPIISYYLRQGDYHDLHLLPMNLKTDYYSFSFPLESNWLKTINPLVVSKINSADWHHQLENHRGKD